MSSNVAHDKLVKVNRKKFLNILDGYAKDYGIVEPKKKDMRQRRLSE